jgi:phosphatidylserine/phosphatidylglycerophosphate/cardiolipin synthase-like enzyme
MKFFGQCSVAMLEIFAMPALAAASIECRVDARFSSLGSVVTTVTESIRDTKDRLTLALYGFDNNDLADELLKLVNKNVTVRLKVDTARSATKKILTLMERLKAGGVQVQNVAPNGRNHNKFAVIDGKRVLTGSYNWTLKSENNWENLLVLDCLDLAKAYESEWERIR